MIHSPPQTASSFNAAREEIIAWRLAILVLLSLLLVKPLGPIPWLGPIAFTIAAGLHLYLPIWRMDKCGLDYDFIGLKLTNWRADIKIVGLLCLITFPPYILGYHLFMTHAKAWLIELGELQWARYVPYYQFAPQLPTDLLSWLDGIWWFGVMSLTHLFGVALPEETFYRGYLQPRLAHRWPKKLRIFQTPMGMASLISCSFFALGHWIGEWNPLRLGPFFPALIFAWQRNRTSSILGAISFHALCNILGELLFRLYQPITNS